MREIVWSAVPRRSNFFFFVFYFLATPYPLIITPFLIRQLRQPFQQSWIAGDVDSFGGAEPAQCFLQGLRVHDFVLRR